MAIKDYLKNIEIQFKDNGGRGDLFIVRDENTGKFVLLAEIPDCFECQIEKFGEYDLLTSAVLAMNEVIKINCDNDFYAD